MFGSGRVITEDDMRNKMLKKPVHTLVAQMAVPTTISQIITVIYNTADTYFVANIGKSAAAAVGVGFSLMSIIQAIGSGMGMGAGSLISRELGAKKPETASRHGSSALALSIVFALILSIVGLAELKGMMRLLGSSETMLSYACDYCRYILIGCPVMCASLVLNIILRSEGSARFAMFGIFTGGILNIILDAFFIRTLGMGIAGAAIATVISQFVSLVILIVPFIAKRSIIKLKLSYISHSAGDYVLIFKTGAPTICRQGLASIAAAMLNVKARMYGDAAIAAVTIANKIYLLVRNIVLGIGQGYQPVAGYNFGAGNKLRTRHAFSFACLLGTVISTVAAVVVFFNARSIICWFQDDSEVIAIGIKALYFACIAMPFMAYSTYVDQLYQCLGFCKTATFLACCRQGIMFLPVIIILPEVIGITGVQCAQPLSDILSFLLCIPFQVVFFRKVLRTYDSPSKERKV